MEGLRIHKSETRTHELGGAIFICKPFTKSMYAELCRAHIKDERTQEVDTDGLFTDAFNRLVVGWENVFDADTEGQVPVAFSEAALCYFPDYIKIEVGAAICRETVDWFMKKYLESNPSPNGKQPEPLPDPLVESSLSTSG